MYAAINRAFKNISRQAQPRGSRLTSVFASSRYLTMRMVP